LFVAGVIRRLSNHKRAAREAFAQALEIFETCGARLWIERTERELRSISGRQSSRGELTTTEAKVARLAAAGKRNKEIADELFLSVRTVETHLSHVYAKLGVRSRTELVSALEASEQQAQT
jgi:DNA-binding NarL/FixJ family response regulator